jgi:hypothetical protein
MSPRRQGYGTFDQATTGHGKGGGMGFGATDDRRVRARAGVHSDPFSRFIVFSSAGSDAW